MKARMKCYIKEVKIRWTNKIENKVLVEKIWILVRANMQYCYENINLINECVNLQLEENNYSSTLQ